MKVEQLLYEYTGQCTPFLRFPGGTRTAYSFLRPPAFENVTDLLSGAGFQYFDWTVEPESSDYSSEFLAQETVRLIEKADSKSEPIIVLLHDTRITTVNSLEYVITWGIENGYVFKGIDSSTEAFHFQLF